MRLFFKTSVVAVLSILPMVSNAAVGEIVSVSDPAHYTGEANVAASTAPKYALAVEAETDTTNVATAGYVKGAYNAAIKAINKVSETAEFAGTASELTDTNFQAADKTSAAKAANAAMAAAAAAQSDVDAVEGTIGNTTLTTTAQTLTGAIEEVKSNALTSSSLTNYAKKVGVTQTITNSSIAGTIPTVVAWGTENTGTAAITASITGATYAEPANP